MTTVAEYNNNPGNIRPPEGAKYEGMIGKDENGFAIFESYDKGRAALEKEIRYKIENQKLNNPSALVDRWAPASKENPEEGRENYKMFIANRLGLESTTDPFPKNSYGKIADAIEDFESGKFKPKEEDKIPEEDQASEQGFLDDKARVIGDLLGMGAGAAAAKTLDIGANLGRTGAAIRELPGLLGQSRAPGDSSGAKWLQNWGNIQKPGFSGGVPEAAAQYQKMQPKGKIVSDLAKRGLITPQPVTPGVPPTPQLSIKGQPPTPTPPGPLSQAGGMLGRAAGAVASSPLTSGALGGLSMAEQGQEMYRRYQNKDIPGMMISGAGALGGGLQIAPHPVSRVLGAGLSAASPLTMYLYDKLRSEPKPMPASPQEMEAARMPAFVYPRP